LGQLKLTPDQIKYVGISHFHAITPARSLRFRRPPC
jgi:hypothetical protein